MGRVIVGRVIVGRVIVGRVIVGRVNGYPNNHVILTLKNVIKYLRIRYMRYLSARNRNA